MESRPKFVACIKKIPWNKGRRLNPLLKNDLHRLYWDEGMSQKKIADYYGTNQANISRQMKDHGIPVRTQSEMMKHGNWNSPEACIKRGKSLKKRWINPSNAQKIALNNLHNDPEIQQRRIASFHKRPNKTETKLIDIIESNQLPFKFVGNGKLIIGRKNPDFIHLTEPIIIELFGRYWHEQAMNREYSTEKGRRDFFREYGYETLIIWDDQLDDKEEVVRRMTKLVACIQRVQ